MCYFGSEHSTSIIYNSEKWQHAKYTSQSDWFTVILHQHLLIDVYYCSDSSWSNLSAGYWRKKSNFVTILQRWCCAYVIFVDGDRYLIRSKSQLWMQFTKYLKQGLCIAVIIYCQIQWRRTNYFPKTCEKQNFDIHDARVLYFTLTSEVAACYWRQLESGFSGPTFSFYSYW